jgi:curli biogenesis system outer membrane secretion channel CsgG
MEKKLKVSTMMIIFIAFVLSSCGVMKGYFTQYGTLERRARQAYQREDYDQAVFNCVQSLKINPNYDKAQRLIQDAFRLAVEKHLNRIGQLKSSAGKFKWDNIVPEYEALIKLNNAVGSLPILRVEKTGETIQFKLTDYSEKLRSAKEKAAEAHYQEGIRLSQKEEINSKKQAAKEFKLALSFVPGYKDAIGRYEKCKREATMRVAVIPFEDKSGKTGRYGALSEMITDKLIAEIMNDPAATEFLELVTREELEKILREQQLQISDLVDEKTAVEVGKLLGVHSILTGKITQILYVPPRTTQNTVKRKARVVVREEKYKDEEGKEHIRHIYGDVYATVTTYSKSTKASIIGSYKIIEVKTASIKKSAFFEGKAEFEGVWAKFSGDERALTGEDESLIERGEQVTPTEEEMVLQAAHNLAISLSRDLKSYVK